MNSIMERSSSGTSQEDMAEDRFSKLPEDIKHTILYFLPTEADRICLSVVSKTWHTSWASFPILRLSESLLGISEVQNQVMEEEDIKYMRQEFINFAKHSLRKKTFLSVLEVLKLSSPQLEELALWLSTKKLLLLLMLPN
ncbi:hypothetical protein Tsubulata_019738 [Turnera subulata]|uniref:F-box domain-containing protein n=1 Tax=Turnera subulata TaxID=218843 RepID=A0A9Q0FU20_9ROSI|nr:hypothetical protein Tsubulata_019738 [Turnera subulata]